MFKKDNFVNLKKFDFCIHILGHIITHYLSIFKQKNLMLYYILLFKKSIPVN